MSSGAEYTVVPPGFGLMQGIDPASVPAVLDALKASVCSYGAGEFVPPPSALRSQIAVVVCGSAAAVKYGSTGTKSILHEFGPNRIINFVSDALYGEEPIFDIYAREDLVLMFVTLGAGKISDPVLANYVQIALNNLSQSMFALNTELMVELDIRRRRTTRGKVLAYLEYQAKLQHTTDIRIPFDRQELADFLCVDRAALSRELGHLRDEGQIEFNRNHFILKLKPRRRGSKAVAREGSDFSRLFSRLGVG